jgi:acetyltransferase
MSTYRLDRLLAPRSIAVVGASPRDRSVGRSILRNVLAGGFRGPVQLVNPKYREIDGIAARRQLTDLQAPPDLVIIAAPPSAVPEIVSQAGAQGCAAAIIVTSGLGHGPGSVAEAAQESARRFGLRLVGPNCLGVLVPRAKLNASFAVRLPPSGDLALISQSGAIAAGLAEWGAQHDVGFSAIVSLGDKIDVDFGDLLDYFALDPGTRSILLYVEAINDARKFMSAARAAVRTKPVVVVKAGRHAQGAKAAATHTGALAGSDAVYDAAFRKAGLLRVQDLAELFAAAETITHVKPFWGRRLAILTNGGGIGVLAIDRLMDVGGTLASLSADTFQQLDATLPPTWSRANPVDIGGDADTARYTAAFEALLQDESNDAVLVINVPTSLAAPTETAQAIIKTQKHCGPKLPRLKPTFAVWIGDGGAAASAFDAGGIPNFASEADAVRGFMHLVHYSEGLTASVQIPPSLPEDFTPDVSKARDVVRKVVDEHRTWLDPLEIVALFEAYDIPIPPAALARNAEEAAALATRFLADDGRVAIKILSPDIVHKAEVGGVALNLSDAASVNQAAVDILHRARTLRPEARISGITVHPMILRPKAYELIAGIADDPTFGPVIVFGSGGTAVETINDKALALPPLNLNLAHDLIGRTRVSHMLKGYRNVAPADQKAIALVLLKLAQLAADLPEIRELDINPLLADENGVLALDARAAVADDRKTNHGMRGHPRFAVRPYPIEWEKHSVLKDSTCIFVRPIRPEDERLYADFLPRVKDEDLRLRFFSAVRTLTHEYLARFTQIDYARAMAFVALDERTRELLAVARLHADANYEKAEFAVLVRSDIQGRGLGWLLIQTILDYARAEGLKLIDGQVLAENTTMLKMCKEFGFAITPNAEDTGIYDVLISLGNDKG